MLDLLFRKTNTFCRYSFFTEKFCLKGYKNQKIKEVTIILLTPSELESYYRDNNITACLPTHLLDEVRF
jgi:hypothetical protein